MYVDEDLVSGANAIAVQDRILSKGAERVVFRCTEICSSGPSMGASGIAVGQWLVAKETLYEEQLLDSSFHYKMAKIQVLSNCRLTDSISNLLSSV